MFSFYLVSWASIKRYRACRAEPCQDAATASVSEGEHVYDYSLWSPVPPPTNSHCARLRLLLLCLRFHLRLIVCDRRPQQLEKKQKNGLKDQSRFERCARHAPDELEKCSKSGPPEGPRNRRFFVFSWFSQVWLKPLKSAQFLGFFTV